MRASTVVKRQFTDVAVSFLSASQAAISRVVRLSRNQHNEGWVEFLVPNSKQASEFTVFWCALPGLPNIPISRLYVGPLRGLGKRKRDFHFVQIPMGDRFQPSQFVEATPTG
jgi:hypothetical protein